MSDSLTDFLAPFPAATQAAVAKAVADQATVVAPEPALAEFRRSPGVSLGMVSGRLRELWRSAPAPGRVVWCLSGAPAHGLDDFEVPAVLGREMHLDLVDAATANGEKRLVAIGTLREESVAVSFRLPDAISSAEIEQFFSALSAPAVRPAIVFVTADAAARVEASSPAAVAARKFVAGGGAIGLRVPKAAASQVLAEPQSHVAPLSALAGQPVQMVRCDEPPADAFAFDGFMRASGLRCDTSMPVDSGAVEAGTMVRAAAYAGASPYRPQPFDLRMPWFHADAGSWFELPAKTIAASDLSVWWRERGAVSDAELSRLLDNTAMEAFYRASRIDPSQEEQYPSVRVYNWPAPAPASRVTLFDGGEASAEPAVALFDAVAASVQQAGPRAHLVGERDLLARAAAEVAARYVISATRAIEAQNEAHEYLATVPHEAPLRPDYADFARFVAPRLGDALELGSGYGVLAWALSLRSRRYTCVDLDRHMFAALRADLGQAGLVADLHRLPFGDKAFDSVVANNVLEHLYDPLAGLTEIRRILRPGGRVFALVPLDALNARHALPAHLWKLDEQSLRLGLGAAGLQVARLEIVHLNELGVVGAFPTCHGLAAMFEAVNGDAPRAATVRVPKPAAGSGLPGRLLPVVREAVRFEAWGGRRVLAVGSDRTDLDEFTHFGATVTTVPSSTGAWPVPDASADLVYAFLTLTPQSLDATAKEIRRVLAPGGVVVAGFRNRFGLRYRARVQSYFADACDLRSLVGSDAAARVADDDGATADSDYVTADAVSSAFASFTRPDLAIRGLTPEDVPGAALGTRDPRFWAWLSHTYGRFILLRAER